MAQYDTHGYDAVIEIGEPAIDKKLACMFATGNDKIPVAGETDLQLSNNSKVYVEFLFDTPYSKFVTTAGKNHNKPAIEVSLPFDDSYTKIKKKGEKKHQIEDVQGTVKLVAPFRLSKSNGNMSLSLDFSAVQATVDFTKRTKQDIKLFLKVAKIRSESKIPGFDEVVKEFEETIESGKIGLPEALNLDLTIPAKNVDLKVLDGDTSDDRALLLLADRDTHGSGNANAFTDPMYPVGANMGFYLDSDYLLAEYVRRTLANIFKISVNDFDWPCTLTQDVESTLNGRDITIKKLQATVVDGNIDIKGNFSTYVQTELVNFWANATVKASIEVTFRNGQLAFEIANTDVNIEVPWYADIGDWFIDIFSTSFIETIKTKLSDTINNKGSKINEAEGKVNKTLSALLDRMIVEEFSLNKEVMAFVGELDTEADCKYAATTSDLQVPRGGKIDLDTGKTTWADEIYHLNEPDLLFEYKNGQPTIRPTSRACLIDLGLESPLSYMTTNVLNLELKDYPNQGSQVISGGIPYQQRYSFGFFNGFSFDYPYLLQNARMFAVYTSEGRYAKCMAYMEGDAFVLSFVTYDRPTPSLLIEESREITEKKNVVYLPWASINMYAFRFMFTPQVKRLAYPINYDEWVINGTKITGKETRTYEGHEVHFDLEPEKNRLIVETELGKALHLNIGLKCRDARGLVFEDTVWVDLTKTYDENEEPRPNQRRTRWEYEKNPIARLIRYRGIPMVSKRVRPLPMYDLVSRDFGWNEPEHKLFGDINVKQQSQARRRRFDKSRNEIGTTVPRVSKTHSLRNGGNRAVAVKNALVKGMSINPDILD